MSKGGDQIDVQEHAESHIPLFVGGASPEPGKIKELDDPIPAAVPSDDDPAKESNPFTDRDPRMLAYAWTGFLLRIMLVVGALFSALQYTGAKSEKRVERTLELVDMWDGQQFQEAQRALRVRLVALNDANKGLLGANPTEKERAVFSAEIGKQLMTDNGGTMPLADFQPHFDRIVYFLNRVGTCVKGNLCDREVADEYFLDFARSFWTYFADYARNERQISPNFAKPIEQYVMSAPPAASP